LFIKELTISDLFIGYKDSIKVELTMEQIDLFAKLSGDFSPIHTDESFAKEQGFTGRVAHGALLCAYVSSLIGNRLPGRFGILYSIELNFQKPVVPPETLNIEGEVIAISTSTGLITTKIKIKNSNDQLLASGRVKTVVR
jgi:3-hydroxybutyryl-CoA dehydratase